MKTFGIYLAYPPTVDLRAEGLGRHLSEFLKGARERGDVRFVIACPSWLRANLLALFEDHGLDSRDFELVAPSEKPLLLRLHAFYVARKMGRKPREKRSGLSAWLRERRRAAITAGERTVARTRSPLVLAGVALAAAPILLATVLLRLCSRGARVVRQEVQRALAPFARIPVVKEVNDKIEKRGNTPASSLTSRLFAEMERSEFLLMRELIEARDDVIAWYSPTAFWPQFNDIRKPRLTCVPDVVLTEFPVGFAPVGGDRFLDAFKKVEACIDGGEYFVTYSEEVKWRTLVGHYFADPDKVFVVPHGANQLDSLIGVHGLHDSDAATAAFCRELLRRALRKAVHFDDATIFAGGDVRFLFFASQFRPNKNVLTLLRAYEHLLRRRYIGHKLVLTGHPDTYSAIRDFVSKRNLENDVIFLNGLTAQELAACYKLADMAVNPSLSEGGCPFTFTEALSVGTPVAMARIAVTEEVIADPALQDMMLFDPYDWRDMAQRIEWAIKHREELLEKQKPFYERLAQRNWRTVVDSYITILEKLASHEDSNGESNEDAELQGITDTRIRRSRA